jgi:hypothetical protein
MGMMILRDQMSMMVLLAASAIVGGISACFLLLSLAHGRGR